MKKITTKQMALIGLMAAVICILGPWSLTIAVSPVPISLCTLAIYFVISVLGMKLGTISVVIYILLGLVGLPVFSGFSGGAGKLFGPTGGYIIGYIFMALISGFFIDKWSGRNGFANKLIAFVGMLLGTAICYLFGTVWLAYQLTLDFPAALAMGVLPYIPFDLIKIIIAMLLGCQIHKRLVKSIA